jgi:glycosyltransferase involved in cell wall biosynthesis
MKLSLLIPTRNSGNTVSRCLDSIVAAHFSDYEIVVYDSSSTDDTIEIVNRYKSLLPITVIANMPKGICKARKSLIEASNGEYLAFIDADDSVENNYWKVLAPYFYSDNTFDMIVFSYYIVRNETDTKKIVDGLWSQQNSYDAKEIYLETLLSSDETNSLWNKIIKTKAAKNVSSKMDAIITYGEDRYFLLKITPIINKVVYLNEPLYSYYINQVSSSRDFSLSYFDDLLTNITETHVLLEKNKHEEYTILFDCYCLVSLLLYCQTVYSHGRKNKETRQ